MLKTKEVELFGRPLLIGQRSIRDIIDASNFSRDNDQPEKRLFVKAYVLHCGLKVNLKKITDPKNIPWFHFLKKWKAKKEFESLKKIISVDYIQENLTPFKVDLLTEQIFELDFGPDALKKKAEG